MAALQCDICGGKLMGRPGGIFECDSCGMEYDTAWAKEKIQEIKGTVKVEGTVEVTGTVHVDGPVKVEGAVTKENLVKRAKMKLENAHIPPNASWFLGKNAEYNEIKDLLEQALVMDPEYAEAHLYMALLNNGSRNIKVFRSRYVEGQSPSAPFQQFCRFATGELAALAEEIQQAYEAEALRRKMQQEEEEKQRRLEQERKEWLEKEAKRQAQKERQETLQRLAEVRARIAPVQKHLDSYIGILAVKKDGTIFVHDFSYGAPWDVRYAQSWSNIVAVSAGFNHCVGLRADGTVVATKVTREGLRVTNYYREDRVEDWKDIVDISAGAHYTVGLKKDGTVVAVGENNENQCNVADWKDIVAIAAGYSHTVGLKKDGTAVAVGWNHDKQCVVWNWDNLVAVRAGYRHTVGLKKDGTVLAVGKNENGECNVANWKDIVAIAAGEKFTAGLKADGTVVIAGEYKNAAKDWKNVVALAGFLYPAGITEDGQVLTLSKADTSARSWKLFNHIDTLAQEKVDALKAKKEALQAELSQLKGIFSGKRRNEIETQLEQIRNEIKELD